MNATVETKRHDGEVKAAVLCYAVVERAVQDATATRVLKRPGNGDSAPTANERDSARAWLAGREARVLAEYSGYPRRVMDAAALGVAVVR